MLFSFSHQWWNLYADFPTHTRKQGDIEISEAPLFASVVHYYAALRGVHTWEIAEALHWPQEETKHILRSLEEPTYIQHCIDVSRYLCIPRRLRDTALQRAGYHLDISNLPPLDREHTIALARLNNALPPQETAQIDAYMRAEGWLYEAEPTSLNYDTLKTYEHARDVMHLFLYPYRDEYNQHPSHEEQSPPFDTRPGLAALDKWIEHLEGEIKRAIWERLDQLLYLAYHFYDMGTNLWSHKATIDTPTVDSPVALHYRTNALHVAQRLGNVTFLIKSHLDRATIYFAQQRYHQSLQDVKEVVRYMAIERKTLRKISPEYLSGDIKSISTLAEYSTGQLQDQYYHFHSQALEIREDTQEGRVFGRMSSIQSFFYEDSDEDELDEDERDEGTRDKEDRKEKHDYSFDDWDEVEASAQFRKKPQPSWRIQEPIEEAESETQTFSLGVESERRFLHLVAVYQNALRGQDAPDAVKLVLGKGQREVAIDLLLAGLTHKKHLARAKAALMLGELKAEEAVEPLIEALRDEHGRVRWSAATALRHLEDTRAVPALLAVLTNQESKDRLLDAIQWDVEHQNQLLSKEKRWSDESKVRVCATEALGALHDMRAVEPLIEILLDHEWKDQQEATESRHTWEIGGWEIDGRLALLADHEEKLRCQAAQSLGELHDIHAGETLSLILAEGGHVAQSALLALCHLNDFQMLPTLIASFDRASSTDDTFLCIAIENMLQEHPEVRTQTSNLLIAALSSPSRRIRAGAAHMLGRMREVNACDALIALLDDEEWFTQHQVIEALAQIGSAEAVETLIAHLMREDAPQRREIVSALGHLGNPCAVDPLLSCLTDKDEDLRKQAVIALGQLGDQRSLEALNAMLDRDEHQTIQPAIFHALCQLHDPNVYTRLSPLLKTAKNAEKVGWIARALGELGDPQAIKPLVRLMRRQEIKYDAVREIPEALQKIGGKQAGKALCQIVQDIHAGTISIQPFEARYRLLSRCVTCLKKLGDPQAVETLLPLIEQRYKYKEHDIRLSAVEALAAFKDSRITESFITIIQEEVFCKQQEFLTSFNWKLVSPMIVALGESDDPSALPLLKQLSQFVEEDFFDLPHEARFEYTLYEIGPKTMAAIERLMQRPIIKEEMQQWQWTHA